ncbi:hypothetical protein AB0E62_09985 [Streptomyces sp. NPDC038707]|uniref:hypothetical protein n=1 Tax=unclassified Streptomyces TaxID=2593676 RepID=UPI0033C4CCC2
MRYSRRIAITAAASVAAMSFLTGQALATTGHATGTFYYTDLLGGNQQVVNPELGTCKLVSVLGTSVSNQTNATAVLYTDTSCALLANPVSPGSTVTFVFKSYRFV